MLNIISLNNYVACKPFETMAIQKQGTNFMTVKQKNSLYWTEVVFPCTVNFPGGGTCSFNEGAQIAVAGTDLTLPWSRTAYKHGDTEFILVPMSNILLREVKPYGDKVVVPRPLPTSTPGPGTERP